MNKFRLIKLEDVDEELAALLREAYAIGRQEHLDEPKQPIRP
jgi:hypothetical protein